ncbi:unnamed protein product [Prunus armeniaca]
METLDFVVVRSWALELKHRFLRAGSTVEGTGVVPAEGSPMLKPWEVCNLLRVSMWDSGRQLWGCHVSERRDCPNVAIGRSGTEGECRRRVPKASAEGTRSPGLVHVLGMYFSKPSVRLFNPCRYARVNVAEALDPFVVSMSSPAHLSFNKKALRLVVI